MEKLVLKACFSWQCVETAGLVDIVFSVSPTGGVRDTEHALNFYRNLVNELPVENDNYTSVMILFSYTFVALQSLT